MSADCKDGIAKKPVCAQVFFLDVFRLLFYVGTRSSQPRGVIIESSRCNSACAGTWDWMNTRTLRDQKTKAQITTKHKIFNQKIKIQQSKTATKSQTYTFNFKNRTTSKMSRRPKCHNQLKLRELGTHRSPQVHKIPQYQVNSPYTSHSNNDTPMSNITTKNNTTSQCNTPAPKTTNKIIIHHTINIHSIRS